MAKDTLHASLTPNSVVNGAKLKVLFDSTGKFKSAKSAIVEIIEIDAPSEFEGKDNPVTLLKVEGVLDDNAFSVKKPPDIPAAEVGAATVKIELGTQSFDVPLSGRKGEHGIFELVLAVKTTEPSGSYQSPKPVFVRAFDHFVDQLKRPRAVITFVTGGEDEAFFKAAEAYWEANADVVVAKNGISVVEILNTLNRAAAEFGPWGQVNIVAHGHLHDILLRVAPGQEVFIHTDKIQPDIDAFGQAIPAVESIDGETQIVFRACNAGNDQELITEIHSKLFNSHGTLFIPKFVQAYQSNTSQSQELFFESLFFAVPGPSSPVGTALDTGLRAAFDALVSPGKGGDPNDEIPLFNDPHDGDKDFVHTDSNIGLEALTNTDGTLMTDAQLVASFRKAWVDKHKYQEQSSTWKTDDSTWRIVVTKKKLKLPGPEWFSLVTKGTADPKFQQLTSGGLLLGSANDPQTWRIQAAGVEDQHAIIHLGPNAKEVTVEDLDSGSPTIVNGTPLAAAEKKTFTLPVTVRVGSGEVVVSDGEAFDLKYECSRRHVDRRRLLREFSTEAFAKRPQVVPTITNLTHYGKS